MRNAAAGLAVYIALLQAAYLVSGSLRATLFDRLIGAPPAAALEGLWLVSVGLAGAALIPISSPQRALRRAVLAGIGAAVVFFCVDALIAVALCGVSLERHFSRFAELAGWIQAFSLAIACLAPVFMLPWSGKDCETET